MPFAAAVSEHPRAAHALGEVVGQVLEALVDEPPDLVVLFATGHHEAAFADAAAAIGRLLRPGTLVGCTAAGVVANGREIEETPAVALWAGRVGPTQPFAVDGSGVVEERTDPPFRPSALVLLADPFGRGADVAIAGCRERWPGLPVVGALASAGRRPGGNRLVLDDRVRTAGAVGVFLGPAVEVDAGASQGARPVGPRFAVTAAAGARVIELAGRRAVERLQELLADELHEDDAAVIDRSAVHVGRLADEGITDPGRGDFLVGPIVAASTTEGWIELAEPVALGDTLQFHLRDVDSADDDLRATLAGHAADGALVLPTLGRGRQLFDAPHHDAGLVAEYLGRPPAAGIFGAGVIAPVGGRNVVLDAAAALLLVRDR